MPKKYEYNSIVIDSDGELIVWTNGHISAPQELKNKIKTASLLERQIAFIQPFGTLVTASIDSDDLIEVTAALMSANPGRSIILEAPQEVLDFINKDYKENGEHTPGSGHFFK